MFNIKQIKEALRNPCAWPGGYTMRLYMTDGECLCRSCALANLPELYRAAIAGNPRDSWAIMAHDVHWEGPADHCVRCDGVLPSEYGDPNEEEPEEEQEAPIIYPWSSEVYPEMPYGDYGSLPAFVVTHSPGGRRARWTDYNVGVGLNRELSAIDRGLRADKDADPVDIARQAAAARYARLAAMRDEYSAARL